MDIDPMISNAGRLRILAALAGSGRQEFVSLRQSTHLTDGNLASHARRLQSAGFISVDKQFRAGKPVTTFTLTPQGRSALESHVQSLMDALGTPRPAAAPAAITPRPDRIDFRFPFTRPCVCIGPE